MDIVPGCTSTPIGQTIDMYLAVDDPSEYELVEINGKVERVREHDLVGGRLSTVSERGLLW